MGVEIVLGIAGLLLTAACGGIGGAFWLQNKGTERVEQVRRASDDRVDKIFAENKSQMDLVLSHVQRVEDVINDMRAELPTKYVLREDHLRLVEKVESLRLDFYRREGIRDA
jgi:hypothetical protein